LSARKASPTSTGKKRKVTAPSQISTTWGEMARRITRSQRYARTEEVAVTA